MKRATVIYLNFLILFVFIAFCNAEVIKLKEVVITESKEEQTEEIVTHKVDIIGYDEIGYVNLPNRNLSELIKYQPGNFVNPLSRNDANWGSYGGLGPKYNAWLLDGLPIDSFVDPMSLSSLYIKRVEVHRGPASVLYPNYLTMDFAGNETPLAGVVHIILKDKIEKPYTNIAIGYGSWNTLNAKVYHENGKGELHYFLGADYEQSDYTNYGTNPSWLNMLDDPEYKKFKGFFRTSYFFGQDNKISLFAHHTQHTGDTGRPHRAYDHQYDVVNLAYDNVLNQDLKLMIKGGYRYYDRSWEEDNYPANLSLREKDGVIQHIFPFDFSLIFRHYNKSLLTAGVDYQDMTYETYSKINGIKGIGNDVEADNFGIYLQEKFVIDKWILRAGARYNRTSHDYTLIGGTKPDVTSKSWSKGIWSIGARYNLNERVGIFANAGSSYLVPSAKSVGGTLKITDKGVPGKNGQLPNPGLAPEKGLSYDVGLDLWPFDNVNISLRGFYHSTEDTIVENVISTNPSQTQSVNAGESDTKGFEIASEIQVKSFLKTFGNLTIVNTEVKNPIDVVHNGSDIPFVPNLVANIGLLFKLPYELSFSPYFQYIGKYYDSTDLANRRQFGKYGTLNANIQKQLLTTNSYSSNIKVELNNIFNKKYEMPWQFQDVGFNIMVRCELIF